jgi:hypothetical protein
MTEKYKKYVLTDLKLPEEHRSTTDQDPPKATRVLWLDNNVIEGAMYASCVWYLKAFDVVETPHAHDFDEIIAFFGSDPKSPHDLGAEVELWLEDEKYLLTKSCLVFVPKGLKHCPLRIRRVDRPIFHFTIGPGGQYIKK